jgi:phage terminase large subunit-like protein
MPKKAMPKVTKADLELIRQHLAAQELLERRFANEKKRRQELARLQLYVPYEKQRLFHTAGKNHRERAMLAGNQIGKTLAGSAEMAMHLTGRYPDWWDGRVFDRAIRATSGSESAELTRDGVQRLMLGPPRDESAWGTGMIPQDALLNWTRRTGCSDALDGVVVAWGGGGDVQASHSTLNFKSYDQGRSKWQADTLDVVWFDEEPPLEIYSEGLTRISSTGGMVYCTFTPLLGMSDVCRRFLLEPSSDRVHVSMTIDDAPHYSPADRARIVAGYPPHEREARARGIPALGSGRIFPVAEEDISIEARIFPKEFTRIRGLDFGYDHPFACVELVHDRDEDIVYVTRAFRQSRSTPVLHASAIRAWQMEWVPIAWPHDGLQADKGSGEELAAQYRREKLNMLPERATFLDGGSGVEAGLMLMLDRMQTGRFKVFSHLNDWFEEFRLYHRKDGKVVKEHDDLMSATRYALMMLRYAITEPVKRPRNRPSTSWQAA